MPGPAPKDPKTRQRTNRHTSAGSVQTDEQPRTEAPSLGEHPVEGQTWHPRAVAWWLRIWASPVAVWWVSCDEGELIKLAVLEDSFWKAPTPQLAAEIRLQRQCFGLSPLDRRRLQWEVVRADEAARKQKPPAPPKPAADDPRRGLTAI